MQELYGKLAKELIAGNEPEVKNLTQRSLDEGATARQVLENGLLAGMDVVGKRFKAGDMFIPEVLLCARAMHSAMDILEPLLSEGDQSGGVAGKVVIGTVEGDLHDIGKNLVAMMMEGTGFKVIDLGVDVKAQDFVDAIKKHNPDIIGMSALLTTTMQQMERTVEALRRAGIRHQVKIMAGGAPVTQKFVDKIGADAYGANAVEAVEKAKTLLNK